jgi:hypothetical protein
MGRGVSTMEPWTLGMVGVAGGGLCHSQEKRFLTNMSGQIIHDNVVMLCCYRYDKII